MPKKTRSFKSANPVKTVFLGGSFAVNVTKLKKDKAKLVFVGADCNCTYCTAKIHVCEDCIHGVLNEFVSRLYHEDYEIIVDDELVFRNANEIIDEIMQCLTN